MTRWIGFVLAVFVTYVVLGVIPVIGPFVHRTGLIGLWITVLVTSWLLSFGAAKLLERRRDQAQVRTLEAVASPHNRGKLGSLHLARGRVRKALSLLEEAVAGEPDSLEWQHQLGAALMAERRYDEALAVLAALLERDPEYGYGKAQMRYAECLARAGRPRDSFDALATFERNHGPSPESAYRMGLALREAGEKGAAKEHFERVRELAREVPRYQRAEAQRWALKSYVAG